MPFDNHGEKLAGNGADYETTHLLAASTPPVRLDAVALYAQFGKRAFDVSLILLALPVVLTLILLMVLIVASDGHKPFYTQERVGRNGKVFKILKIRTMVPNADKLLQEYLSRNPTLKAEWDCKQKLKNDFRVTWIGRILRKSSMDELPQLWNVLTGSMSLVGPRPMMATQKPLYTGRSYYQLRPGITGFWQVSDRHTSDFQDRVKYDEVYEKEMSFMTDLKLLMRTVAVVCRGTGC